MNPSSVVAGSVGRPHSRAGHDVVSARRCRIRARRPTDRRPLRPVLDDPALEAADAVNLDADGVAGRSETGGFSPSHAAHAQLAHAYEPLGLYLNFFQPVRKLAAMEQVRAKVVKRYDEARTPYQRLLAAGVLDDEQRRALESRCRAPNATYLLADIDATLITLATFAEADRGARLAALAMLAAAR